MTSPSALRLLDVLLPITLPLSLLCNREDVEELAVECASAIVCSDYGIISCQKANVLTEKYPFVLQFETPRDERHLCPLSVLGDPGRSHAYQKIRHVAVR